MFKRVIIEDWANVLPIISFAITAAVFLIIVVRAIIMPKNRREHLSHLPLDPDPEAKPEHSEPATDRPDSAKP